MADERERQVSRLQEIRAGIIEELAAGLRRRFGVSLIEDDGGNLSSNGPSGTPSGGHPVNSA